MTIQDIRIAVLIPTRGDRELFLNNCFKMLDAQTLQPHYIELVDYEPESQAKDITQRYKRGYKTLSGQGYWDIIFFIEDDDYYAPNYLEVMASEWIKAGQPDILGTGKTIYYHIKLKKYFTFNHPRRSSAMNTLIKPNLNIQWCEDSYEFTDMHLWNMSNVNQEFLPEANRIPKSLWLTGHIFNPENVISIGMKHGVGLCGGRNHIDRLARYDKDDNELKFLREHCDEESFKFYSEFK